MKIDLTETEIIHLMDALDARIEDLDDTLTFGDDPMIQDQIGEMRDLATDLFEAISRQDDGWIDPDDPDLFMDPVNFAAKHDIDPSQIVICDAEINAETATSRAADRRALKFSPPGQGAKGDKPAPQPKDRSEMQDVDVWEKPANDPVDW